MLYEKTGPEILEYYEEMYEKQYKQPFPKELKKEAEERVNEIIQRYGSEAFAAVVVFMHHRSRPYYLGKKHDLELVLRDEEIMRRSIPDLRKAWQKMKEEEEKARKLDEHNEQLFKILEDRPTRIHKDPME